MTMTEQVELELPRDAQYVGLARLAVTTAARQAGMDAARVEDLRLAVSEATTNAMMGQADNGSAEPVVLAFGRHGESAFAVTITGGGPGLEAPSHEAPENLDWSEEGGLGVTLIRGLADEVEFIQAAGSRTGVRFAVSLLPEEGEAPMDGNGNAPLGEGGQGTEGR